MSAEPDTIAAPPPPPAPAPAELNGLRGARLAARVRQALYRTPPAALADAFRRMREGGTARHLDYFSDGVVQTIRVFPCPVTILPDEVEYVHRVVRTIHDALVRLPELYLTDHFSIFDDHLPAPALGQTVGRQRHRFLISADNDHMMAVMSHSGSEGAFADEAKPADQAHHDTTGAFVTLD